MKKTILLFSLLLMFVSKTNAQKKIWNETDAQKTERLAWWTNDRFGMFIHWGTYAFGGKT